MDVRLVVVEGSRLGTVIPLRAERFRIGRDRKCQLRPKSPAVSQFHCVIQRGEDQVSVQDLGSTNGTLVNDRCLREGEVVRVKHGDRLQVAQLIFAIEISAEPSHRRDEELIVDWLNSPDAGHAADASGETAMLPAIEPGQPRRSLMLPADRRQTGGAFIYLKVDETAELTCLGLSPLQLDGDAEVHALRRALRTVAVTPAGRRLILDLAAVDSLPSTLFALLHTLALRCRRLRGGLRLCAPTQDVRKRLTALRLDGLISCHEDCARALADDWES